MSEPAERYDWPTAWSPGRCHCGKVYKTMPGMLAHIRREHRGEQSVDASPEPWDVAATYGHKTGVEDGRAEVVAAVEAAVNAVMAEHLRPLDRWGERDRCKCLACQVTRAAVAAAKAIT